MEHFENIISPEELKEKILISEKTKENINKTRDEIKAILEGKDSRKIFIIGPCSIHNYDDAIEYAVKLKETSDKVKDKILILMRVYLEKPRTTVGWKGFINDPDLDESHNLEKGLELSRKLLLEISDLGIGIATEFLDILVYPYISDLISWAAIGARTSESQTHRQIVSELLMPVGFKNSVSGNIDGAINSIISSKQGHCFIGIDGKGKVAKITTSGNSHCHLVLRGGDSGPNYERDFIEETQKRLVEKGLFENVMIDCSHGNSCKDYAMQKIVFKDVIGQMKQNPKLIGLMLESYLEEGNQKISKELKKGVSITDSCIGWEESEKLILEGYSEL